MQTNKFIKHRLKKKDDWTYFCLPNPKEYQNKKLEWFFSGFSSFTFVLVQNGPSYTNNLFLPSTTSFNQHFKFFLPMSPKLCLVHVVVTFFFQTVLDKLVCLHQGFYVCMRPTDWEKRKSFEIWLNPNSAAFVWPKMATSCRPQNKKNVFVMLLEVLWVERKSISNF